jgi:hypothetical protein
MVEKQYIRALNTVRQIRLLLGSEDGAPLQWLQDAPNAALNLERAQGHKGSSKQNMRVRMTAT